MAFNKALLVLLLWVRVAVAAVYTVCPGGFPWGSCNYPAPQSAFNAPASGGVPCGNEIQLAPIYWDGNFTISRSCAGNPMTVTSMRKAWLPASGTRITPAHRAGVSGTAAAGTATGNVPTLRSKTSSPALSCTLDSTLTPCSGWHFVGIAATFDYGNRSSNAGGIIVLGNDYAAERSTIPDDVIFDRSLVFSPPHNPTPVNVGIQILGSNLTVKNSFISDIWASGHEAQGINGSNVVGPETYTNNFIASAGIPIFHDGGTSMTYAYANAPNGATIQHNYFYKWPKWNNAFHSPERALFQSLGWQIDSAPCVKNLGEMKNILNGLWQYNVHENAWGTQFDCQSNNIGFTYTPRGSNMDSRNGCCTAFMSDITLTDSTHATYTSSNVAGDPNSLGEHYLHHIGILAAAANPGDTTLTMVDASRLPLSSCSPNCHLLVQGYFSGVAKIKYTGISGNVLTGIPPSGPGSIPALMVQQSIVNDYEPIYVGSYACPQWTYDANSFDVECRRVATADYDSKSFTVEGG